MGCLHQILSPKQGLGIYAQEEAERVNEPDEMDDSKKTVSTDTTGLAAGTEHAQVHARWCLRRWPGQGLPPLTRSYLQLTPAGKLVFSGGVSLSILTTFYLIPVPSSSWPTQNDFDGILKTFCLQLLYLGFFFFWLISLFWFLFLCFWRVYCVVYYFCHFYFLERDSTQLGGKDLRTWGRGKHDQNIV